MEDTGEQRLRNKQQRNPDEDPERHEEGERGGEVEKRRWKGGCGLRGAVGKRCGACEGANHRREPRVKVKREETGLNSE